MGGGMLLFRVGGVCVVTVLCIYRSTTHLDK